MGIQLPGWLRYVGDLVGEPFPEGDETACRRQSDRWRHFADQLEQQKSAIETASHTTLLGFVSGEVHNALQTELNKLTSGGPGSIDSLIPDLRKLADATDHVATEIETAKMAFIVNLGLLAATVAALIASAWINWGAPGEIALAVAAARAVLTRIVESAVLKLVEGAAARVITELVVTALEGAVINAVISGGINAGIQGVQMVQGHRDGFDLDSFGRDVGSGAIQGAVAGPIMHGAGKFDTGSSLGNHARNFGAGFTANTAGALAAQAPSGQFNVGDALGAGLVYGGIDGVRPHPTAEAPGGTRAPEAPNVANRPGADVDRPLNLGSRDPAAANPPAGAHPTPPDASAHAPASTSQAPSTGHAPAADVGLHTESATHASNTTGTTAQPAATAPPASAPAGPPSGAAAASTAPVGTGGSPGPTAPAASHAGVSEASSTAPAGKSDTASGASTNQPAGAPVARSSDAVAASHLAGGREAAESARATANSDAGARPGVPDRSATVDAARPSAPDRPVAAEPPRSLGPDRLGGEPAHAAVENSRPVAPERPAGEASRPAVENPRQVAPDRPVVPDRPVANESARPAVDNARPATPDRPAVPDRPVSTDTARPAAQEGQRSDPANSAPTKPTTAVRPAGESGAPTDPVRPQSKSDHVAGKDVSADEGAGQAPAAIAPVLPGGEHPATGGMHTRADGLTPRSKIAETAPAGRDRVAGPADADRGSSARPVGDEPHGGGDTPSSGPGGGGPDGPDGFDNPADHRQYGPNELKPVENPAYQSLVESQLRQVDGSYRAGVDPRTNPYGRLINDGGDQVPGRANNCNDCALSGLSSFFGHPTVAAPRFEANPLGEAGGLARAESWLGDGLHRSDTQLSVPEQFAALHQQVAEMGPGSAAYVVNGWQARHPETGAPLYDANGQPVLDGSHATAVVYPHDAEGPVWWDPQSGATSDHPPAWLTEHSAALWSTPIPHDHFNPATIEQGAHDGGAGHAGEGASLSGEHRPEPAVSGDPVRDGLGLLTDPDAAGDRGRHGSGVDEAGDQLPNRGGDGVSELVGADGGAGLHGSAAHRPPEGTPDLSVPVADHDTAHAGGRGDHRIPDDGNLFDGSSRTDRGAPVEDQQADVPLRTDRYPLGDGDHQGRLEQPGESRELAGGGHDGVLADGAERSAGVPEPAGDGIHDGTSDHDGGPGELAGEGLGDPGDPEPMRPDPIEAVMPVLERHGVSLDEFMAWQERAAEVGRDGLVHEFTSEQLQVMYEARMAHPHPGHLDVIQKVVGEAGVKAILEQLANPGSEYRGGGRFKADDVGGCVSVASDAAGLRTPSDLLRGLRLDYGESSPYEVFTTTDHAYVIEGHAAKGLFRVPNGRITEHLGITDPHTKDLDNGDPPHTGTGYTGDGHGLNPEYQLENGKWAPGAELIRIDADGSRHPVARLEDGPDGPFWGSVKEPGDHVVDGWPPHQGGDWVFPDSPQHGPHPDPADGAVHRGGGPDGEPPGTGPPVGPGRDPVADVRIFERSALETDAGAAFFDPADATMRSAAGDVPPVAGEFTVDVHGDAHAVSVWDASGVEHRMAAPEFAEVIRNNTGWDGQTPIRLLSCDTGSGPYPFAADLARELGVPVTAPDRPVWTFPDGREPVVTGFDRGPHGEPAPRIPPDGQWNRFNPDGMPAEGRRQFASTEPETSRLHPAADERRATPRGVADPEGTLHRREFGLHDRDVDGAGHDGGRAGDAALDDPVEARKEAAHDAGLIDDAGRVPVEELESGDRVRGWPHDDTGYPVGEDDLNFLGIDHEQVGWWQHFEAPLGMTPEQFREFTGTLKEALVADGIDPGQADIRLQGSSAQFFSGPHKDFPTEHDLAGQPDALAKLREWMGDRPESERPERIPFDAKHLLGVRDDRGVPEPPSDYDVQFSSDAMVDKARETWETMDPEKRGPQLLHEKYDFVKKAVVEKAFPALYAWKDHWEELLGREVAPALFGSAGPPDKTGVGSGISTHFRDADWIINRPGDQLK